MLYPVKNLNRMKLGLGVLTLLFWIGSTQAGIGLLFKHDGVNGDTEFPNNNDDDSTQATTTATYRFFGTAYTDVYVSTNGYLTFNTGYWWYNPAYTSAFSGPIMVAPWWSDVYLSAPSPDQHIWYRESTEYAMLQRAERIIRQDFGPCGNTFVPTHVFILTYEKVVSYCQAKDCCMGGCSRKRDVLVDEYNDMENKPNGSDAQARVLLPWLKNTFQVVMATNGVDTFVINNMHIIEWDCCFNPTKMLFNAGNDVGFYMNPAADASIATTTNVGPKGRWIYKISGSRIQDETCAFIGT